MKITGTDLSMIRGDTESITVELQDKDGNPMPLEDGDTIYFTVKTSVNNEEKILQKVITEFTNGKAPIVIEPEDTKSLDFVRYVYDIQLTRANGEVRTLVGPSTFAIGGEVTYE